MVGYNNNSSYNASPVPIEMQGGSTVPYVDAANTNLVLAQTPHGADYSASTGPMADMYPVLARLMPGRDPNPTYDPITTGTDVTGMYRVNDDRSADASDALLQRVRELENSARFKGVTMMHSKN